jgi:cytoskeleton protein RodZ
MAPEVGQWLREARLRGGIELIEAEQATKIRVRYLRAMEDERWELLPAPAYARGFLRAYARFLGLDDEALVREYGRHNEPAGEATPPAEPVVAKRGGIGRPRVNRSRAIVAGLVATATLGVLYVLGLTSGSGQRGRHAGPGAGAKTAAAPPATTSTTTTPRPTEVSLRLQSTGTVWVCLVDERGRALINGLTLGAGEARGPFRARRFKATLGTGYVRLEVDNKPIAVPRVAEPLGYQITSRGVSQLGPSSRPTCT